MCTSLLALILIIYLVSKLLQILAKTAFSLRFPNIFRLIVPPVPLPPLGVVVLLSPSAPAS